MREEGVNSESLLLCVCDGVTCARKKDSIVVVFLYSVVVFVLVY